MSNYNEYKSNKIKTIAVITLSIILVGLVIGFGTYFGTNHFENLKPTENVEQKTNNDLFVVNGDFSDFINRSDKYVHDELNAIPIQYVIKVNGVTKGIYDSHLPEFRAAGPNYFTSEFNLNAVKDVFNLDRSTYSVAADGFMINGKVPLDRYNTGKNLVLEATVGMDSDGNTEVISFISRQVYEGSTLLKGIENDITDSFVFELNFTKTA